MGDHDRYEDDLAAYLLDALARPEAIEFERHLAGCELCRSQARWLQGAIDVLPESVEQLEPPARLRKRLIDEVNEDLAPAAKPERSRVRSRWRSLISRPAFGLATACVLIAAVGGYAVGIGGDGGSSDQTTVAVNATAAEPSAKAELVRTGDSAMLKVDRLPVQPRGKVYEVWMHSGDKLEPASLFVVRPDGTGVAAMPHGIDAANEVMVTLEPEHGSAAPTSEPVLRAEV